MKRFAQFKEQKTTERKNEARKEFARHFFAMALVSGIAISNSAGCFSAQEKRREKVINEVIQTCYPIRMKYIECDYSREKEGKPTDCGNPSKECSEKVIKDNLETIRQDQMNPSFWTPKKNDMELIYETAEYLGKKGVSSKSLPEEFKDDQDKLPKTNALVSAFLGLLLGMLTIWSLRKQIQES